MNKDDLGGRKRRSQVSREKYKIVGKAGARYVLSNQKGEKLTKSRFELLRADEDVPEGKTFNRTVEKAYVIG